jgi:hypothetical protein
VLAVPAVAVEKDEMGSYRAVRAFVDSIEAFD